MDLAVVSGAVKGKPPFYKWIRGVEVCVDVMRWCFTTELVMDSERDVGRAAVVFEAHRNWRYRSRAGRLSCA
jgi:hypothetical protein